MTARSSSRKPPCSMRRPIPPRRWRRPRRRWPRPTSAGHSEHADRGGDGAASRVGQARGRARCPRFRRRAAAVARHLCARANRTHIRGRRRAPHRAETRRGPRRSGLLPARRAGGGGKRYASARRWSIRCGRPAPGRAGRTIFSHGGGVPRRPACRTRPARSCDEGAVGQPSTSWQRASSASCAAAAASTTRICATCWPSCARSIHGPARRSTTSPIQPVAPRPVPAPGQGMPDPAKRAGTSSSTPMRCPRC